VGQLAGRLKEILRGYGVGPEASGGRVDALAALEASDPKRAHEVYLELRREAAFARLDELRRAVLARGWIVEVIADPPPGLDVGEIDREIREMEAAERAARAIEAALAEARAVAAGARERLVALDFEPFARVAFPDLARAVGAAEDLRRRAAREGRNQARYRAALARAAKLGVAPVPVPDLRSAAVPDPDACAAALDDVEARLDEAERLEAARARARRPLADPATSEHARERRRALLDRIEAASRGADRRAAVAALAALESEAESLRREAARRASEAARARRRGLAGPERDRRGGDLQDMYG